jgi:hypothetical protein
MTYLGGHSGRAGLLGVMAFPEDYPSDTEFTMFYMGLNGNWTQLQFKFDVASATYMNEPGRNYRAWWLAGKRGEIVEISASGQRVEQIATAGTGPRNKYGYLSQIRSIGDTLFACGYRRQVYRRDSSGWTLISKDILDDRKKGPWNGFESIDGFAPDDVFAVGDDGEIWHYDGRAWTQIESPTNQTLADVRCWDGEVWACGDGGTILRRDKRKGWTVVWSNSEPAEEWWSLEKFNGEIYVAGSLFLGKLSGKQVVPVTTGIADLTTQTLHAKEGTLWSIGAQHILSFDGKAWTEHAVPENR